MFTTFKVSLTDMSLPRSIGRAVALMHDAEIVHGDLTTSNMMLRQDGQVRNHMLCHSLYIYYIYIYSTY